MSEARRWRLWWGCALWWGPLALWAQPGPQGAVDAEAASAARGVVQEGPGTAQEAQGTTPSERGTAQEGPGTAQEVQRTAASERGVVQEGPGTAQGGQGTVADKAGAPKQSAADKAGAPKQTAQGSELEAQRRYPRAKAALEAHSEAVAEAFRAVGASWPPKGLLLVAYKLEGRLEIYTPQAQAARPWVLVRALPICARSGVLGPKNAEGDLQVPEGFYEIDGLNPRSRFHLSVHVNYPNRADRLRIPKGTSPGHSIMVHGKCETVGCLPMRDEPMSWIYAMIVHARQAGIMRPALHIHPCHHGTPTCEAEKAKAAQLRPELTAFWADLATIHGAWLEAERPPRVRVAQDGRYLLR